MFLRNIMFSALIITNSKYQATLKCIKDTLCPAVDRREKNLTIQHPERRVSSIFWCWPKPVSLPTTPLTGWHWEQQLNKSNKSFLTLLQLSASDTALCSSSRTATMNKGNQTQSNAVCDSLCATAKNRPRQSVYVQPPRTGHVNLRWQTAGAGCLARDGGGRRGQEWKRSVFWFGW